MAYTDLRTDEHRIAKLIAVSAFHTIVAYGLVTGLGISYDRHVIANLPTKNYPADPPPTPQAPPPKPAEVIRVIDPPLRPVIPLPDLGGRAVAFPLPPIADDGRVVLPPPIPGPPVGPAFTHKQPRPRNDPGTWVLTSDYPPRDIREGNEGTTRILLSIDPGGRVLDCRISGSSGHASLDDAACKAVSRRARFDPASDGSGGKLAGTYSNSVRWVIPKD